MRTWTFILLTLLSLPLFAQDDSRFEVFLRTTTNAAKTGATVYIVHMATSDSLLLTEVGSRPGWYRRDNVEFGNYKVYVNSLLTTTNKFFGTNQIYLTLSGLDPDGNYQIDTGGIEDAAVTWTKLAQAVKDSVSAGGGGGAGSGFDQEITGNSIAVSADSVTYTIASFGYTNAPKVVIVNTSGWGAYVALVTNTQIRIKPYPSGFGDRYEFDLFISTND